MRRAVWACIVAFILAALGCTPQAGPNPGPPLEKNPHGPGPMQPPGEGDPSLPPKQK